MNLLLWLSYNRMDYISRENPKRGNPTGYHGTVETDRGPDPCSPGTLPAPPGGPKKAGERWKYGISTATSPYLGHFASKGPSKSSYM